jgi:hypothetical protein
MKAGRFEAAVLTLFLLISPYQLFIPPLIGIADNGDFERMRIPNGLMRIPDERTDQRFDFFHSKFAIVPQKGLRHLLLPFIHSSVCRRGTVVERTFHRPRDLRCPDAWRRLSVVLPAGNLSSSESDREWQFKWRCLLAISLFILFTDVAYFAYFNSFYSEPTA